MVDKETSKEALEQEVQGAISAFEQILEAMPNDRASLEALSYAYEQIGDEEKEKEYMLRLGRVLLDEQDVIAAQGILDKLNKFSGDSGIQDLVGKIIAYGPAEELISATTSETAVAAASPQDAERIKSKGLNIDDELSLAWNLSEAEEITQEEYASIVQDLTEMSAGNMSGTVSALHVIESRGFKGLDRILGYISKDCSTPIVSILNFDFNVKTVSILPEDFMLQRGVLVFETLGDDALVVVMNPYSKQVRIDTEMLAGKKCHFYSALPSEFDQALDKVKDMLLQAAVEE